MTAHPFKKDLTAEQARALWTYDKRTGVLTWLPKRYGKKAGQPAGYPALGYLIVDYNGRKYQVHRIAWLIVTGEWPAGELDHRNLKRSDNRWRNLRPATRQQNQGNLPITARNKSGRKGVCWDRRASKWKATIGVTLRPEGAPKRHTTKHLGLFDDLDEAAAAYLVAAQKRFGEFARLR